MPAVSRRYAIRSFGLLSGGLLLAGMSRSVRAAEVSLAIKGYDPVAYFSEGKPVHGLPEFAYEWDERTYHFSTAAHRDQFIADPVHFAPQFGNYCAMALANGKSSSPTQRTG